MTHPRVDCKHASIGRRSGQVICALGIVPDNSHVGVCEDCRWKNADVPARTRPAKPRQIGHVLWPRIRRRIERRAEICKSCKHNQRIRMNRAGRFPVNNVKCELCGCGGLSLSRGECPLNLWPRE